METLPAPDPAEKTPRWVIPTMLVFFLFPSLPHVFNSLFPGGKIINEKLLAENLAGSLVYEWVLHGLQWLGIGLANLLFLAFIASAQGRRGPGARFWQDLSLLSFSLHGGILIIY